MLVVVQLYYGNMAHAPLTLVQIRAVPARGAPDGNFARIVGHRGANTALIFDRGGALAGMYDAPSPSRVPVSCSSPPTA